MKRIKRYFITGLLVTLPLFISVYVLIYLFLFIDGILGNIINVYFKKNWGFYVPGLGLFLLVLIVLIIGFLSSLFIGKLLQRQLDRVIDKFPLLKFIYMPLKQIFGFLFSKDNMAFKRAVLVEFPNKGSWTLGFITNETFKEANDKTASELLNIFVPLAPNPTTGFIIFARKDAAIFLDMSIQDAMKFIISGGLLNPADSANGSPAKT